MKLNMLKTFDRQINHILYKKINLPIRSPPINEGHIFIIDPIKNGIEMPL